MKSAIAMLVVVMGCGGVMGQKPVCNSSNIGQPYTDTRKQDNPYPEWICTHEGWMNIHPGGQPTTGYFTNADGTPAHTPLKCGKYEYNAGNGLTNCHGDPDNPNIAICTPVVDCKPLTHTVTEKEWQELMARLKKLEYRGAVFTDGSSATDCTVPPDDPTKVCDKNQPSQKKFNRVSEDDTKNAHYQCLYNYGHLSDLQQQACMVINMIEAVETRQP